MPSEIDEINDIDGNVSTEPSSGYCWKFNNYFTNVADN